MHLRKFHIFCDSLSFEKSFAGRKLNPTPPSAKIGSENVLTIFPREVVLERVLELSGLREGYEFEREVTAERIRDKIAASKRKGMWMGGLPPLGYDNVDKKLVINEKEAETGRDSGKRPETTKQPETPRNTQKQPETPGNNRKQLETAGNN